MTLSVHVVSHTHWDREWYLTYEQFRLRLVDLVERVLDRLDSDPEFTFHLDGQTVVLGGILETERRDTVNKVPYLGDIPGLGVLFRSKSRTDNKDELLIFVTPKILREGANLY